MRPAQAVGEALEQRMEDERGESHLGRDAHAADAMAREQAGAEHARADLQEPGQDEPHRDPDQRRRTELRQHLGQEMEADHAGRGGEGEGARQLQQDRVSTRRDRERAAQQRGSGSEQQALDHARCSSRGPSGRGCVSTRPRSARRLRVIRPPRRRRAASAREAKLLFGTAAA